MDCSPSGSSSMEFPRQEYWTGLPFLLQGIFPTQGLNPVYHMWANSLPLSHHGSPKPWITKLLMLLIFLWLWRIVLLRMSAIHTSILYILFPSLPKKKKKSKRHIEEKATALWIYQVRVSLVFRVRVWGFCFNAFLRVKLSSFLLLHLRLPESSVNKCVLSLFPSAGLGEDSEWWVHKISFVKYIHSLE